MLSLAWNILCGYSGYFSFGHAAFWGLGAYTVALGMMLFRPDAMAVRSRSARSSVGLAGALIGFPTFRLRGHYFALAMLAYPLAMLYVFQWLGYQEIPLPMKREAPYLYMQFADPRVYVVLALGLLVVSLLISLRIENSRFGMSLLRDQAERAGRGSGGHRHLALEDAGADAERRLGGGGGRALRGGALGGDAGSGLRHAGLGPGADPRAFWRRREPVGTGHRRGGAGAAGGGAQRQARQCASRHSGRRLRCRDHRRSSCARPRACIGASRTACRGAGGAGSRARLRFSLPRPTCPAARAARTRRSRPFGAARCQHLVRRVAGARRDRPDGSRRAGFTASSAPTAPARRRCSTSSTGFSPRAAAPSALPASRWSACGRAGCAGAASAEPFRSCARFRA